MADTHRAGCTRIDSDVLRQWVLLRVFETAAILIYIYVRGNSGHGRYKQGFKSFESLDYRYDNVANPLAVIESPAVRVTYVYDRSNQLTAERRSGMAAYANTYTYDRLGNRLVKAATGDLTTTTYDGANQIRYSVSAIGRVTYTYDANGNQQIVDAPVDRTTYAWDYENQNTGVRRPANDPVTMTFNADLRRVSKES